MPSSFFIEEVSMSVFYAICGIDLRGAWLADTRSIASLLIPGPGLAEGQKYEYGLENLSQSNFFNIERINLIEETCPLMRWKRSSLTVLKTVSSPSNSTINSEKSFHPPLGRLSHVGLCPRLSSALISNLMGWESTERDSLEFQSQKQRQRDRVLRYLNKEAAQPIRHYHELQVVEVSRTYKEMYEKAKSKAKDQAKCVKRYALLESAAISRLEPFNWNSSEQLKWLFKDYYGLDIFNKREEKETTNEAMLKELASENRVARLLLLYRELEKLCSTCIPALLDNQAPDQCVHSSYNVGGTRTGRLSSSGPNLQQIPKGTIRSFIHARSPGRSLVTIDYAQIEVRIIAHLAKEKELIHAFKEEIDPYSLIAQKLLKIKTAR
jgi:hypothetical protein